MSLEQLELDLGKAGYRLDKGTGAVVDGSGNIMADLTKQVRKYLEQLMGSKTGQKVTQSAKDAGAGLLKTATTPAGRNMLAQRGGLLGGALATGQTILRDVERGNPVAAGGALVGGATGVGAATLLSRLAPQRGLLGAAIKVGAPIVGGLIGSQTGSNVISRTKGQLTQEPDNLVDQPPAVREAIQSRQNTYNTNEILRLAQQMRPELVENIKVIGAANREQRALDFVQTQKELQFKRLQQQAYDANTIRNQAGIGVLANAAQLGIIGAQERGAATRTLLSTNPYAANYAPNISFT